MPIFPVCEAESLVQEGDKTRLEATKSFVSGTTAITVYEVKPYKLGSFVDVTSTKYLDWIYDFEIDVDALNNKINFTEGGPELTATITTGSYSLSALASEIKTQLDAAGAFTYTVTVNSLDQISIDATGNFQLLGASGSNLSTSLLLEIGFEDDTDLDDTATGDSIETVNKTVSVKITNLSGNDTVTKTIQIISERADHLFSEDAELTPHELDILRYVRAGRTSFLDKHRAAQDRIITRLDEMRVWNSDGSRITKSQLLDVAEVNNWSRYLTLQIIFEGISNAVDDVFSKKAEKYAKLSREAENRAVLRWDQDNDGTVQPTENTDLRSFSMRRR
jgi:hypothetical protein